MIITVYLGLLIDSSKINRIANLDIAMLTQLDIYNYKMIHL